MITTPSLFEDLGEPLLTRGADLSPCQRYRYQLSRSWGTPGEGQVTAPTTARFGWSRKRLGDADTLRVEDHPMPRTKSQQLHQRRPPRRLANADSRGRLRTGELRMEDAISGFQIPQRDAVRNYGVIVDGSNWDTMDWPTADGAPY